MDHLPSADELSRLHNTNSRRLSTSIFSNPATRVVRTNFAKCDRPGTPSYPLVIVGIVCYGRRMDAKQLRPKFNAGQIAKLNIAVSMAEELVSNFYKMSANQWLRPKFDVRTLADLTENEVLDGPFAQIVRYEGKRKGSSLGSGAYDFYKICIQDHAILAALQQEPALTVLPFCLYIMTHELIHIVRFSKFLQSFDASPEEKLAEEQRVHKTTHDILHGIRLSGLAEVLAYYQLWHTPIEDLSEP